MSNKKLTEQEEKELKEALDLTLSGEKIFYVEEFGNVKVVFPSINDSNRAEYEYSKAYNEALFKDGFPTIKEVEKIIKEKGLWTEENEKALEDLDKQIAEKLEIIAKVQGEKGKAPYQKQLLELQKKRAELKAEKDSYFLHTAEYKADQARINYLIWACTYNADTGKRLWPSYEAFKEERRQRPVSEIATNFLSMLYGIDDSLLREPPQTSEVEAEGGEEEEES
ncbi:MAG: hypothetical protein AB7E45_02135 [Candidatus Caldatribacteriota bacterium]